MDGMLKDRLLTLDSFKLFLLIGAVPFLSYLVTPMLSGGFEMVFAPILLLSFLLGSYWMYSIGKLASELLPEEHAQDGQALDLVWVLAIVPNVGYWLYTGLPVQFHEILEARGTLNMIRLLPLVGAFYYTASLISTAENGGHKGIFMTFMDMLAFFMYPVGLWALQPRVKALYERLKNGKA